MPRDYPRSRRVGDLIPRELAQIIQHESLGQPHEQAARLITIAKADVSPDLANAKIYVTSLDESVDRKTLLKGLNNQAGHYRHCLAQVLTMRGVPRLKFVYDEAQERGARLTRLIDSLDIPASDGAGDESGNDGDPSK